MRITNTMFLHVLQSFILSAEAQFSGINPRITHENLAAELAIIMGDDLTYSSWKKAFTMHEDGTLVNPDTQQQFIKDHEDAEDIRRSAHAKKKNAGEFVPRKYVAKPLNRETFKTLTGITSADLHTAARRLTELNSKGLPRVCFRQPRSNNAVLHLPAWANQRKWKNIIIHELARTDPDMDFIVGEDGHQVVNRPVWVQFKKSKRVTKAKWAAIFEVATTEWLNKKRTYNHKTLPPSEALQNLLDLWLRKDGPVEPGRFMSISTRLEPTGHFTIGKQRTSDRDFLGCNAVAGCLVDFRFIPGHEDGRKAPFSMLETLARYINEPKWFPGLSRVPIFMLISDEINYDGAKHFISFLSSRHPDTYVTMPSYYTPCPAEDLPEVADFQKWRDNPVIHIWFVVNKNLPQSCKLPAPFAPPDFPRYFVKKNLWSERSYEMFRGELRMEAYFNFLDARGGRGKLFVNFFGGLKPCAAALVGLPPPFLSYVFHLMCIRFH